MDSAARQAAEQIAALINSRVQSPRIDEMEAIIAGATARYDKPQDDQTLAALRQKIAEVARLYEVAKAEPDGERADLDKADAADNELTAISKRIFATWPITISNLQLRALLAKHWHGFDAGEWKTPDDCDAWEHTVMAHLIDGVLKVDTPPVQPSVEVIALPSPELATFRSALAGAAEFRRANPEPDVAGPGYDAWYEQHGERLDGVWKLAESILAGKAPPLDVLSAIAVHYILDDHPELIASAADGDAHDSMATWIVARLLHAVQPSIQPRAGE
jgi:hypothetical protein